MVFSDDVLETHFSEHIAVIERSYHVLSKTERVRVERWILKLSELGPKANRLWRRRRNQFSRLLAQCVRDGALIIPFTSLPPDGDLPRLEHVENHYVYHDDVREIMLKSPLSPPGLHPQSNSQSKSLRSPKSSSSQPSSPFRSHSPRRGNADLISSSARSNTLNRQVQWEDPLPISHYPLKSSALYSDLSTRKPLEKELRPLNSYETDTMINSESYGRKVSSPLRSQRPGLSVDVPPRSAVDHELSMYRDQLHRANKRISQLESSVAESSARYETICRANDHMRLDLEHQRESMYALEMQIKLEIDSANNYRRQLADSLTERERERHEYIRREKDLVYQQSRHVADLQREIKLLEQKNVTIPVPAPNEDFLNYLDRFQEEIGSMLKVHQ